MIHKKFLIERLVTQPVCQGFRYASAGIVKTHSQSPLHEVHIHNAMQHLSVLFSSANYDLNHKHGFKWIPLWLCHSIVVFVMAGFIAEILLYIISVPNEVAWEWMCAPYEAQCMLHVVWLLQLRGWSHVLLCTACGNVVSLVETSS